MLDCQIQAKICGQTYAELDAALEHLGEILEYFEEFQWTFRRKIGIFRSQKLDAELEYIEEISLINRFALCCILNF